MCALSTLCFAPTSSITAETNCSVENFIPGTLIGGRDLGDGDHLLERVHGKNPYVQIDALERRGVGTTKYKIVEVQ